MRKIADTEFIGKYIGKRIKSFMSENDVTLLEVAKRMEVSSPTLSTFLSGRTPSSNLNRYEKAAIAAGMSKARFEEIVLEARRAEMENSDFWNGDNQDAAFRARHGISDEEKWKLVQGFIDMITKSDK